MVLLYHEKQVCITETGITQDHTPSRQIQSVPFLLVQTHAGGRPLRSALHQHPATGICLYGNGSVVGRKHMPLRCIVTHIIHVAQR